MILIAGACNLTESDAKQRWCPMARAELFGWAICSSEAPRQVPLSADEVKRSTRCIGSGCMMWRETSSERGKGRVSGEYGYGDEMLPAGYCGLAGRP